MRRNQEAISKAIKANNLSLDEAEDIRVGKSAVREMWYSLNSAAVIIADLTGTDAGVMYGLGIAHTLGKETILIHPQGSKYLTDIPRTYGIEYEDSIAGSAKLEEQLSQMLRSMLASVVDD
jgi:nucleoside 2-deoxyribosyltransferase